MSNKTHETSFESISALIDDEGTELDLQRLLSATDEDAEIRSAWRRYNLAGSAAKGELNKLNTMDLSASIRSAIDKEDLVVTDQLGSDGGVASAPASVASVGAITSSLKAWRDGLAKTAVAATVAFGFVVGVQQYNESPEQQEVAAAPAGAVVPEGYQLPQLNAVTVSSVEGRASSSQVAPTQSPTLLIKGSVVVNNVEFDNYVNRLMYKHAEQSSSAGGLRVVPFARAAHVDQAGE